MLVVLYILLGVIVALVFFFLFKIVRRENYVSYDDPHIEKLRQRLLPVFPELKTVEMFASNKSFTIDKKEIYICMKDEYGSYYDDNMLTYVIIHELAHSIQKEVDTQHSQKFKDIFFPLLDRAERAGLYNPNLPVVQNYCNYA